MKSKKKIIMMLLAIACVLSISAVPVLAYFTTYAEANGTWQVYTEYTTKLIEEVEGLVKHISVESEDPSCGIYVRVKAFCPTDYSLQYESVIPNSWTKGDDGWYYYNDEVESGERTSVLDVEIDNADGTSVEPTTEEQKFNVVVTYEATPALYRENGDPYPDWKQKARV